MLAGRPLGRSFVAAVTAAVASLSALGPARAAAPGGPAFVSPTGTVTGTVAVVVTSSAPAVKLSIPSSDERWAPFTTIVPVVSGTASWAWPTAGFDAATTITASECAGPGDPVCAGASASTAVAVSNPVDSFDTSAVPSFIDAGSAAPVTVDVTDHLGGSLRIGFADGRYDSTVGVVTRGVPTPLDFLTDSPFTGVRVGGLRVLRCSLLTPLRCAPASALTTSVRVRHGLTVGLPTDPVTFSPDGDGVADSVSVPLLIDDQVIGRTATWTIYEGGVKAAGPKPVTLPATGDTATVEVKGVALPDGAYTLRVDASGVDHGLTFTGSASMTLVSDDTPPVLSKLQARRSSLYPLPDDGPVQVADTLTLDYTASADTAVIAGKVVDESGHAILGDWFTHADAGTATWDGQVGLPGGSELVPEGSYRLRMYAYDVYGNRTSHTSGVISVSHDHYALQRLERTVTARASLRGDRSTGCARLRLPGSSGVASVGYDATPRCRRSGSAAAVHGLVLPEAISYGRLVLTAKGAGDTDIRTRVTLLAADGTPSSPATALPGRLDWHPAGHAPAASMVAADRSVSWLVTTPSGNRYDIARFRVALPYLVWTGGPGGP